MEWEERMLNYQTERLETEQNVRTCVKIRFQC